MEFTNPAAPARCRDRSEATADPLLHVKHRSRREPAPTFSAQLSPHLARRRDEPTSFGDHAGAYHQFVAQ